MVSVNSVGKNTNTLHLVDHRLDNFTGPIERSLARHLKKNGELPLHHIQRRYTRQSDALQFIKKATIRHKIATINSQLTKLSYLETVRR